MARNKKKNYLGDNINGASFDSMLIFANNNLKDSELYYKIIKKYIPLEDIEEDEDEISNQFKAQLSSKRNIESKLNEKKEAVDVMIISEDCTTNNFQNYVIINALVNFTSLVDMAIRPNKIIKKNNFETEQELIKSKAEAFEFQEKNILPPVEFELANTTISHCISMILISYESNHNDCSSLVSYSLNQKTKSSVWSKTSVGIGVKLTKKDLEMINFKFENYKEKPFT